MKRPLLSCLLLVASVQTVSGRHGTLAGFQLLLFPAWRAAAGTRAGFGDARYYAQRAQQLLQFDLICAGPGLLPL